MTSPRVAPGLMSWEAWQAVATAGRVAASDDTSPVVRAVEAAGHPVDVLPEPSATALLAAAAAEDAGLVWLADDEESERLPAELAAELVAGTASAEGSPGVQAAPAGVEVLHGSYDVPGARLLDLVTVMDRLRTDCPWDREQTHRSLARYLLEEAYETLEAVESDDLVHLREELGDLLLQVVFHARIAAERDAADAFSIDDVAGGIVEKLVHRHPHVFAGLDVAGVQEVEANWETLKSAEKQRASTLDGIPLTLPALALADKILSRADRAGLSASIEAGTGAVVDGTVPAPGPVVEEGDNAQLAAQLAAQPPLGDRLLGLVVEARAAGLDAEQELRGAVRRLAESVRAAEASADAPEG